MQTLSLILATLFVLAAFPAGLAARRVVRLLADGVAPPPSGVLIAALALAFGWAAVVTPPGWILAASLVLGWTLVTLAAIDVIALRLPNALTLPLIVLGLAISAALPGAPVVEHLLGAALGYGALAGLAAAYRRLRGKEGVGLGDAKLLAAAGAWLGWAALPSVLLFGCLAAFAWIAVTRLRSGPTTADAPLAFGAPLALATWIVWLHGPIAA